MISIVDRTTAGSFLRVFVTALVAILICSALPANGVACEDRAKAYIVPGDGDDVGGYEDYNFEDSPTDGIRQQQSVSIQHNSETGMKHFIDVSAIWFARLYFTITR